MNKNIIDTNMIENCEGQLRLFGGDIESSVGEWVSTHGPELTFDEIAERIGRLIVMDMSTESHKWYQIVQVEKIFTYEDGTRRLIYYSGKRQRGLVDERYFTWGSVHAYRIPNEEDLQTRANT